MDKFEEFILKHKGYKNMTVAGKNFASFDKLFLPEKITRHIKSRVIDPANMFIDWSKDTLPSLSELLDGKTVSHDAYDDALDVIKILRKTYDWR